ncbi:MAG TPA: SH3 domain-containing protein [Propionibacteriaceae bacterium]|nr:SH3 domain-containing protein [Propionibacteriaceae bacterium]
MVLPPRSPKKDTLVTLPGPARRGLVTEADDAPSSAARRGLPEPLVDESFDDISSMVGKGFRHRIRLSRRAIAPAAVVATVLVATTTAFAASLPGVATGDPYITAVPASASATPAAARDIGISRLLIRTPLASTPTAIASTTAEPTPSATSKAAKPKAKAAATAKATPTRKTLAAVTGTRYATVALNVRAQASASAARIASLGAGDKVSIVGASVDGWQRVRVNRSDAWVKASFLSKTKPAVASTTSTSTSTSTSPSSRVSGAACASGSGVESGLTSTGIRVHRAVCNAFPSVTSYGGYRAGSGEHSQGRALDIMVSGPLGWQIANFLRANASSLGVTEVIYQQRIWTRQRSSDGWRSMSDRGSVTANHYDHVHVTF